MNYALPMVRGEYVVVYDAEDIPEADQLRQAATLFAYDTEVDCLQAELTIENSSDSWLSALFAAEYSGLFRIMIPALSNWRVPVPLGGTSNHFRTHRLREIGGWDAFNVTEDADLGIRLARKSMIIKSLNSRTFEEAPTQLRPWIHQRTRWMKGWMQTFLVHNRRAHLLLRDLGWRQFLALQLYVGSMIVSAPLHLVFSLAFGLRLLTAEELRFAPNSVFELVYLFVFVTGYLGTGALSIAGALRLRNRKILLSQILLPVYWALVGVAAFRAAYELISRPYYWAKTTHGFAQRKSPMAVTTHPHIAARGKGIDYET